MAADLADEDTKAVVSAITIGDPTANPNVGDQLTVEPVIFTPGPDKGAFTPSNWDYFRGTILAIQFPGEGEVAIDGSAVIVAPGIALAAAHVFRPRLPESVARGHGVLAIAIADHGLQLWSVREVTFVGKSDIAILSLGLSSDLPPGNSFYQTAMTTRTPSIGERVMIAGFRPSAERFATSRREPMGLTLHICVGEVTAVFPERRDSSMLPAPVLEVDCSAVGSMSGGAAFDMSGRVFGILSSSYETEDGLGPSYVSLAWPILGKPCPVYWPTGYKAPPRPLLEAASIDRPDALKVTIDSAANLMHTAYSPWSDLPT